MGGEGGSEDDDDAAEEKDREDKIIQAPTYLA